METDVYVATKESIDDKLRPFDWYYNFEKRLRHDEMYSIYNEDNPMSNILRHYHPGHRLIMEVMIGDYMPRTVIMKDSDDFVDNRHINNPYDECSRDEIPTSSIMSLPCSESPF